MWSRLSIGRQEMFRCHVVPRLTAFRVANAGLSSSSKRGVVVLYCHQAPNAELPRADLPASSRYLRHGCSEHLGHSLLFVRLTDVIFYAMAIFSKPLWAVSAVLRTRYQADRTGCPSSSRMIEAKVRVRAVSGRADYTELYRVADIPRGSSKHLKVTRAAQAKERPSYTYRILMARRGTTFSV